MKINKITTNKINQNFINTNKKEPVSSSKNRQYSQEELIMMELNNMANRNNVTFKGNYELNLSGEELEKRTHKDYLVTKKMLKADAPEYLSLADGDKEALKHLVKAAYILEKINKQLDCHDNLEFEDFLNDEIKKGNKQAELTKILYDAQKGINAIDSMSTKINLAKGITELPGKGVYPKDLSKEEIDSSRDTFMNNIKINLKLNIFVNALTRVCTISGKHWEDLEQELFELTEKDTIERILHDFLEGVKSNTENMIAEFINGSSSKYTS